MMSCRQISNVMIVVLDRENPTKAEWDAHLTGVPARCRDRTSYLIVTEGGHPDAVQRAQLKAAAGGSLDNVRSSIVSDSAAARFALSALALFNAKIKGFAPEERAAALTHLEVPAGLQANIWHIVDQLRSGMEPVAAAQLRSAR